MLDRITGGLALFALFIAGFGLAMPSGGAAAADDGFRPLASPSTPVRLVVPSAGLRADVVPIGLPADGVLDPPADADVVGWWNGSRRPGAPTGQTVLTGHTVHTGGGAMQRLGRAEPGAKAVVVTDAGRVVYRIEDVEVLSKAELAERSADLFSQDRGDNRLVLITCTGWNGSEFEENVVVRAEQLGVRAPARNRGPARAES